MSVEVYVERMLGRRLPGAEQDANREPVGEAIDRIRERRKENTLGGVKTKDLIHEGCKY